MISLLQCVWFCRKKKNGIVTKEIKKKVLKISYQHDKASLVNINEDNSHIYKSIL